MAFLWDMKRTQGSINSLGTNLDSRRLVAQRFVSGRYEHINAWSVFAQPHDCMDAGGRVTQEQLPRLSHRGEAQEEPNNPRTGIKFDVKATLNLLERTGTFKMATPRALKRTSAPISPISDINRNENLKRFSKIFSMLNIL